MTAVLGHTASLDERALGQLFRDAHTAYAFTDQQVSDAELAEIYDLVRYAPTGMNAQPLRITFVRSREGKARLLPLLHESNRGKAASAPAIAILSADADFHENLERTAPHLAEARTRFADAAARARLANSHAHLQAGYLILAVRALGLDAGPMGGFDKAAVDREFLSGTAQTSFMLVNIGHVAEDGTRARQFRLPQHEAVSFV